MHQYFPPYKSSSNNIKVELDLTNYATKTDLKNITHTDVSSFASKTNLAALKTEVDKIDADKLKTVPHDLAKLSNVVKNEVVKKADFSADDYVKKTKFSGDKNSLDDKIDKVEKKTPDVSSLETKRNVTTLVKNLDNRIDEVKKKIPDISGLASKTELADVENKIPDISGLATASALTAVENKIPDITSLIRKTDFDTKLKNISDRATNNKSKDILLDNELKKLKTLVGSSAKIKFDKVQKENSFNRGFFYYLQQSYLVYECKIDLFIFDNKKILKWRSTGILNYSDYYSMNGIKDAKKELLRIKNDDETYVHLQGSHFQQSNIIITNNSSVINIYIV